MFKKTLTFLFLVALVYPVATYADTTTNCTWNTLLKQVTCTTAPDYWQQQLEQQQQNAALQQQQEQNNLIQQQIEAQQQSNFQQTQQNLENNIANTTAQALEREQELEQQQAQQQQQMQVQCSAARMALINGKCVSYDSLCMQKYGAGSQYFYSDASGATVCGCQSGYSWNTAKTACVASPLLLQPPVQTQAIIKMPVINYQAPKPSPSFWQKITNFFKNLF